MGESWADTSVATTGEGTDTVTVRRVVTYQATGNEGQGARKAVRIATSHTSEVERQPADAAGAGQDQRHRQRLGQLPGERRWPLSRRPVGDHLGAPAQRQLLPAAGPDHHHAIDEGLDPAMNVSFHRHAALVAGALVFVLAQGCSSSGGSTAPGTPTPKPGPSPNGNAPAPPAGGHGPAVTYKPVRDARYRLEHHDSLNLQYEGGAVQQQVKDRVAFLRVTLAEGAAQNGYTVSVALDSLRGARRAGSRCRRIRWPPPGGRSGPER